MLSPFINQCDPMHPQGASGRHFVSASRAAHASETDCTSSSLSKFSLAIIDNYPFFLLNASRCSLPMAIGILHSLRLQHQISVCDLGNLPYVSK